MLKVMTKILNSKLKISEDMKIKNIFAKNYTPNCFKEVFVIKKIKNTIPSKYLMADLNGEKIIGEPHEQKFEGQMNQSLRLKKIIRRKGTTDIK